MVGTAMTVAITILNKIAPLVKDHIKLTWGLKEELKKLEFLVALINAIQEDNRGRDQINRVDQVWLDNLENIMKEMISVLEHFERRAYNNNNNNRDDNDNDDNNNNQQPSGLGDGDDNNQQQQSTVKKLAMKKRAAEEDGCLTPFSYYLSHPNPLVWFQDGFMARKITTIRKRLTDNLDDKKLLEFHPALKNKQGPSSSSSNDEATIIPRSVKAWTVASDYIVLIQINYLPEKQKLPPLHNLPRLEELTLEYLTLDYIFEVAEGDNPPSGKLFPKLRKLWIRYCQNLKGWWQPPVTTENDDDQSSSMISQFPCLEHLDIREFKDMIWFPLFPNLSSTLYMVNGSIIHLERTRNILSNTCTFKIQYLWLSNLPDLEFLDIELFPNLVTLYVYYCDKFKVWGKKGHDDDEESITAGKVPSSVTTLELKHCSILKCLPQGMCLLDSYTTVTISGCNKLKEKYADKSGSNWPSQIHQGYLTIDW